MLLLTIPAPYGLLYPERDHRTTARGQRPVVYPLDYLHHSLTPLTTTATKGGFLLEPVTPPGIAATIRAAP